MMIGGFQTETEQYAACLLHIYSIHTFTHMKTDACTHTHARTQDRLALDLFSSLCLVWLEAGAGTHPVLFASLLPWREFAHLVALAQVNILM